MHMNAFYGETPCALVPFYALVPFGTFVGFPRRLHYGLVTMISPSVCPGSPWFAAIVTTYAII